MMQLINSYFEEINLWSCLSEEWPENSQFVYFNHFYGRIESIKRENERFLKVTLTTWPGSCSEINSSGTMEYTNASFSFHLKKGWVKRLID